MVAIFYPQLLQNLFRIVALGDNDSFLVLHNFYFKAMSHLAYIIHHLEFFGRAPLKSVKHIWIITCEYQIINI
jgi:hypothetical protein